MASVFDKKINLERKLDELDNKINANKSASISLLEKRENISQDFARVETNIENMTSRMDVLVGLIDTLEKDIALGDKDSEDKTSRLVNIAGDLEEIGLKLDQKLLDLRRKEEDYKSYQKSHQDLNYSIASLKSRHTTYVDMENHHEGFNRGVKEVLKNKSINGLRGAFGELIRVPQKYEKAIEASLGAAIQNVVVENESSAKSAIAHLKRNNLGRVTFLPMNVMKSNKLEFNRSFKTDMIGVCSELISYDVEYRKVVENLLGRVVLVGDIDKAVALARESGHRFKIVTLDGDIVNPGGALTGGSLKTNSNILSRKRIISELELELDAKYKSGVNLETNLEELSSCIDDIRKEISDLRNKKSEVDQERAGIETEIKILDESRANKVVNLESYIKEKDELNHSIENSKKEYDSYQKSLEYISLETQDNSSNIDGLVLEYKDKNLEYDDIVKHYNDKNLDLVREKEIFKSFIEEMTRIQNDIDDAKKNQEKLLESIGENENELNFLDELVEKYTLEEKDLNESLDKLTATMRSEERRVGKECRSR